MICFDLETGGLDKNKHPITQIAMIDEETGDELELKILVNTGLCDKKALEINGYNQELWDNEAELPDDQAIKIADFFGKHTSLDKVSKYGKSYRVAQLFGHNSQGFDMPFLIEWFKRRKWQGSNIFMGADYKSLDTMQLELWAEYCGKIPKQKTHKLGDLYKFFSGNELSGAHDALVDVRATIYIKNKLVECLS